MLDLNEVLMFTKVVETKSFTAAAAALGVPKSTISRKLALLEERLGVRLVQRTTRKLSLTDVGQAYFERTQRIMAELSEAEQVVSSMQASPRGTLRVTVPLDFAESVMGKIVADFAATQPEVAVEIEATNRVVDLVQEGFDVAIRFGPLAETSLTARRLVQFESYLCASPAYLQAHGTPQKITDLDAHHRVLFVPVPMRHAWPLTSGREQYSFGRPAHMISNNFGAVREALLEGAGIGMAVNFCVYRDIAAGRLVRVLPKWVGPRGTAYAVYPSRRNIAPKLAVFLQHLTRALNPAPWDM